jgi:hypothetical protein
MAQLPQTFWGETATENPPALSDPASLNDEAEWTPSFAALGHVFKEAMTRLLNTDSSIMGKTLRTIEDVYNHLRNETAGITSTTQIAPDPEELPAPEKPSRPLIDPAVKLAKQQRVLAANNAWREAIQQRKDVIKQWDDYVAYLHKLFQDARNS